MIDKSRPRLWSRIVRCLSGEWMLKPKRSHPNGGSIVLARSLWIAFIGYAIQLAVLETVDPNKDWSFSSTALREAIINNWAWLGGTFAAAYASLYSRFASQWSYLANLYNQIKSAEVRMFERGNPAPDAREKLAEWKAGFIEDADDLHLAPKPIFASVIQEWSKEAAVRTAFTQFAIGGEARLNEICEVASAFAAKYRGELSQSASKPQSD